MSIGRCTYNPTPAHHRWKLHLPLRNGGGEKCASRSSHGQCALDLCFYGHPSLSAHALPLGKFWCVFRWLHPHGKACVGDTVDEDPGLQLDQDLI